MADRMTWRDLQDLLTALGYKLETFSALARKAFPDRKGLSKPALSRRFHRDGERLVPDDVAKLARPLEPLPAVVRGLATHRKAMEEAEAERRTVPADPVPAPVETPKTPLPDGTGTPFPAETAETAVPAVPAVTKKRPFLKRRLWLAVGAGAALLGLTNLTLAESVLQLARDEGACIALLDDLLREVEHGDQLPPAFGPDGSPVAMGNRRRIVPEHPFQGQKRPPCRAEAAQVLLGGGCWILTGYSPPCPVETYEREGSCYLPVAENPKVPSTTDDSEGKELYSP